MASNGLGALWILEFHGLVINGIDGRLYAKKHSPSLSRVFVCTVAFSTAWYTTASRFFTSLGTISWHGSFDVRSAHQFFLFGRITHGIDGAQAHWEGFLSPFYHCCISFLVAPFVNDHVIAPQCIALLCAISPVTNYTEFDMHHIASDFNYAIAHQIVTTRIISDHHALYRARSVFFLLRVIFISLMLRPPSRQKTIMAYVLHQSTRLHHLLTPRSRTRTVMVCDIMTASAFLLSA